MNFGNIDNFLPAKGTKASVLVPSMFIPNILLLADILAQQKSWNECSENSGATYCNKSINQ